MIHDVGYMDRLELLRWYPWTIDAVRLLNRAGFVVCVTTNQGGVGMGYYTEDFVTEVHRAMTATLDAGGARVDGWFHCPHHPDARVPELRVECDCRKPRPGMIRQASELFDIDLSRSFVVGDKLADVGLAEAVGARGVLVRTGYGEEVVRRHDGGVPGAAFVAADLMAATSWILQQAATSRGAA